MYKGSRGFTPEPEHLILVFLVLDMWYLKVVLVWSSLTPNKVQHLFTCLIWHYYVFFCESSLQVSPSLFFNILALSLLLLTWASQVTLVIKILLPMQETQETRWLQPWVGKILCRRAPWLDISCFWCSGTFLKPGFLHFHVDNIYQSFSMISTFCLMLKNSSSGVLQSMKLQRVRHD